MRWLPPLAAALFLVATAALGADVTQTYRGPEEKNPNGSPAFGKSYVLASDPEDPRTYRKTFVDTANCPGKTIYHQLFGGIGIDPTGKLHQVVAQQRSFEVREDGFLHLFFSYCQDSVTGLPCDFDLPSQYEGTLTVPLDNFLQPGIERLPRFSGPSTDVFNTGAFTFRYHFLDTIDDVTGQIRFPIQPRSITSAFACGLAGQPQCPLNINGEDWNHFRVVSPGSGGKIKDLRAGGNGQEYALLEKVTLWSFQPNGFFFQELYATWDDPLVTGFDVTGLGMVGTYADQSGQLLETWTATAILDAPMPMPRYHCPPSGGEAPVFIQSEPAEEPVSTGFGRD